MEVGKEMNNRMEHGTVRLSIVEGAKAYALNNPLSFFRPYKEGKEVIELGDGYQVINTAAEKTTDFGTKVALAILAMITEGLTVEEAERVRDNLEQDTGEYDYHFFNFDTSDFTKAITGRRGELYEKRVLDAIQSLSSNTTLFQNTKTREFLRFQWLVPMSNKNGVLRLGISRYLLLQTFRNPLSFTPSKLFPLGNKDFRAGLLIENSRISSNKYAPHITNEMAIQQIRPRYKHGQPYLKEIETAFKNAHKAGYPLYKKTVMKYRENAGEITWKMQC